MDGIDLDGEIDIEQLGLPVSNTENKLLEAEVQRKQKEVSVHQTKIDQHADRTQAISEHLKNVKQELHHTQKLLEARKKDVETEDHMRQIAEREEGRLNNELRRLDSEQDDLKDKRNIYENEIYRAKQKTEGLKKKMNWDQQALEAWLEESARHDDDAMTIAKYARADEEKIRTLNLKMEQLHDKTIKKRKLLDTEMIESVTAQIELDKTAENFRKAHHEREALIEQWEQTIHQMRKRDQDMDKCADELSRLKMVISESEALVREKQEFLDREKANNDEIDKKLKAAEKLAAKMRLEYQASEGTRIQVKDELETLKYTVDKCATDLESARGQSSHLGKEIKDKRTKLETTIKQRELMQMELKRATQKTLSAEEHAQNVDQHLAREENRITRMQKELSQLKDKQFTRAQEMFELKRKDTSMDAELTGGKATLRNLGSKQHKLDEELLKQQEILYTQDFQLQQLHHRLGRMEGERTGEEMEQLNERIKLLEKDWERQQGEELLVQSQLKRVQEDLRRINRDIAKGLQKKLTLEEKIDEMNLHIDTTQRQLKKVVTSKQNKMVDENIVKLSVKRLRDHLYARADEVESLEKRKLQLDTAMSERMSEIAVHKEMLRAQIKAHDTERQTVSSELHRHISKIDKLRKRYEIITVSMNPPEGEEKHSQAYYVIKAAQEREELQRHGDELDSKIKKAEKEIRAMENTLLLMNSRNSMQRKNLTKVEDSGEEMVQMEQLEGQWRAAQDKFKYKKRSVIQMEGDMKVMKRNLSSLKTDKAKLSAELQEKQGGLTSLTEETQELKAKQDRVSLQTSKLVKELKAMDKVCGHNPAHVQKDIELREMRDFGSNVVQQLGTLGSKDQDMLSAMQLMFAQAGLPPTPSPLGSRASSQTSSARTSVRSSSSRGSGTTPVPTLLQTATVDIDIGGSATSTPRQGMSPYSSASSLGQVKGAPCPASKASLTASKGSLTASKASLTASKTSLTASKTSLTGPLPHTSSRLSSQAGSQAGSRAGSQAGSRAGSQAGSRAGSQAGSQAGFQAGSRAGSQTGSRVSLQAGFQAGSKHSSRAGSQAGSQAGSKLSSRAGSQAGSKLSSRAGSQAGSRLSSRAGSSASSNKELDLTITPSSRSQH